MTGTAHIGFFAPLRIRRLRLLLLVELGASVGVWILVLAAQWILTEAGESATTISAVQFAISLPFFLFALPIGAIAEYTSHRRLLVGTSVVLLVASIALAVLDVLGHVGVALLMGGVFVAEAGLAVVAIVWQALLPHVVSRDMMAVVPAIDGAVFNGARAIGPLIGGAILAGLGSTWAFASVGVLFAVCALIATWQVPPTAGTGATRSPINRAVAGGIRFIRHSRWTRRLLIRLTVFGIPASCLWALLPLVAHDRLHANTFQFGVISGAIGVGAVVGTIALMPLRSKMSWNQFAATGSLAYAVVLVGMAVITRLDVILVLMVIVGAAWVGVQSTWMIAAHSVLPPWIKARVIAFIMLMFQGSQAVGAIVWGVLADLLGLVSAVSMAAALMVVAAFGVLRRGIFPSEGIAPEPSGVVGPDDLTGGSGDRRIVIETTYLVAERNVSDFRRELEQVRRSRLRLGALRCTVMEVVDIPGTYVEYSTFSDWNDYVSQETERLTVPEQRLRQRVSATLRSAPVTRVLVVPVTAPAE
jgi:MFS family permease